ncbi:flagellar basal body P-ring formation chaperone FlgA [Asticcacaulis solisilvae]|uniref:flagellar basal body P-ring formation chaperone FlgA n=1 Tax=Asticcacaulis solisilvae TaxID=1217274 RepID=UPI003FD77444
MIMLPATAFAGTLTLKSNPSDGDGRITVGDVFDGAGPNEAGIVLGYRNGGNAVLDAATVQMVTARNGLTWDNPRGIRRIVVTSGTDGAAPVGSPDAPVAEAAPSAVSGKAMEALVFSHSMNAGEIVQADDMTFAKVPAAGGDMPRDASSVIGKSVRYPVREGAVIRMSALGQPTVVHRADPVKVTWSSGALSLSVTGTAQKDAAIGDVLQIENPTSKKMIDAIVTGPGEALAGPAADQLRSRMFLSAR